MKKYLDDSWMDAMRIHLDVNNMFADQVGEQHGFTNQHIDQMTEMLTQAHDNLQFAKKSGKHGFRQLPFIQKDVVEEILEYANYTKNHFTNIVVLGIGGSALGLIALQKSLNPFYYNENFNPGNPRLYILDNIDPEMFSDFLEFVEMETSLYIVISKSGGTAETMAQYMIIRQRLTQKLGEKVCSEHMVFVTDNQKGNLIHIAKADGVKTFYIPANVGGRFSALTPVGLLPAALVGIDIQELLAGAKYMDTVCDNPSVWENPAYMSAVMQYLAYQSGKRISVMFPYSSALKEMADWYAQLWAESLGKRLNRDEQSVYIGPTPVKALGVTDQHSQVQLYIEGPFDKVITFIEVERYRKEVLIPSICEGIDGLSYLGGHSLNELITAEKRATELALTKNQRLNCTILVPEINAFTLGQLIQMFEIQTAYAGELFNIDAFDQPGVELGKDFTYGIFGRIGYDHMRKEYETRQEKNKARII